MKRAKPRSPVQRLAKATRVTLHQQLDAMLDGPSTMPDGSQGTVLADIVARQLVGYGFGLSISIRHPNEEGRAIEDPDVTTQLAAPPSLVVMP